MRTIEELYGDEIYRPGQDDIEELTEKEKTDRRKKVEEMFASGDTDFTVNGG